MKIKAELPSDIEHMIKQNRINAIKYPTQAWKYYLNIVDLERAKILRDLRNEFEKLLNPVEPIYTHEQAHTRTYLSELHMKHYNLYVRDKC